MAEIQASYDDLFTAVPGALAALLDAGDVGAWAAVFMDGEPVVDVWGGFADTDRTIPWRRDTITNVWSVTKTMTALWGRAGHGRGSLRLAGRYRAACRAGSTVEAGYRGWIPLDHSGIPRWRGRAPDHRPQPGQIPRRRGDRAAGADFHIGLPAEHDHQIALSIPPPSRDEDYVARAPGAAAAPAAGTGIRVRDGNTVAWRRAQIPAASGFGNARSAALVQSVMACGGTVRGVRLLSQAGCDRAWEEQFCGEDRILGMSMRYGLGYGLFGSTYGWGGWGGSMVMIEPDARMAVSFVTNQILEPGGDSRGLEIVMAAYDGLQGLRA